ncbi:hypothetical protein [Nocardioides marmotae]|uniref:hypothetical protein n=1 Tax=Nocardioides marmotae TaxID=2663857 RepID=UPI0012B5AC8F|nr:hypothetical protein [Nocardioides marmotae]MBC9735205.1 hypothetical protein [Nocardioides marmotae]MTB86305.1 hypothetical protein [Nocardioides marmotae]
MIINDSLIEAVQASVGKRMAVWSLADRSVVATPWTLEDQTPVTLYVTQIGDDVFDVSDAGLASGALADAGVDLTRRAVGESFTLIRQGLRFAPAMGSDVGEWDVAVSVPQDQLGDALLEVSEAVVRTEALRALGRHRAPRTFGDRIIRTAAGIGLRVEPRAYLALRHSGARRRVAYRVSSERKDAFVQTITRASTTNGYDHAKALFSDALVGPERRVTALENSVRLDAWQVEGLTEVSQVVAERDLETFLAKAIAA